VASTGRPAASVTDVQLLDALMVPRVILALTSDLIACRVTAEVAAYITLRLPIPARERITLALFRGDTATAMRLLRQSIV
jgi:hypothetical protein